ncbi:MAG: hypothetical protein C0P67_015725, partial [Bacillota bacterium]
SLPKTKNEKTKMIRCTVVEMQKLYKEMTVQYVISEDLLKKAQDLHNRLMVSLFYSFDVRISTQQDIKKISGLSFAEGIYYDSFVSLELPTIEVSPSIHNKSRK